MRASLLFVALLPCLAFAQIPNGGFESWTDQSGYLDPTAWLTYNDIVTPGGWPALTVEQGSPGAIGSYHAVITTIAIPLGSAIQGWISAGSINGQAGFPYTQRPAVLSGQWQYGVQSGDTAQVQVALTKWNSLTSSSEGIAFGILEVTGSQSTWQGFSVPLEYLSASSPDTAYIQIVSSINFSEPFVGSFVKVDDLAFVGTVGIGEVLSTSLLAIFPNPGNTYFTLGGIEGALPYGPHTITLFDVTGRMVHQQRTTEARPVIDTETLSEGLYRIIVRDEHGGRNGTSWVKQR